ncbi:MAG: endonuclease domain-containing protein [Candidatus Pacebacteria bacterium]|nr:endonuclease domain-containing protein [Candidatus Paceibacterota bacterium]MBP9780352.1 endonuclease domain-containing protein [Candidatus Paceibacterota bacterium]
MTPQELIMWSRIKNSKIGYKLRRQHSIGRYIADFYCSEKRVVVEIDGVQHFDKEAMEHDRVRSEFFQSQGISVVRFTNAEINTNLESVLENIRRVLEERQ